MRVYISYSFQNEELYLLSLLINKLQQQGHIIESSDYLFENNRFNISNSELFIGLITDSHDYSQVIEEWNHAQKLKKRTILLIEEGITVSDKSINYIRFNRFQPENAINELMKKNQNQPVKKKTNDIEDVLMLGGIVVGIAALISLLAGGNKK